jgi:predicted dehydrogenase
MASTPAAAGEKLTLALIGCGQICQHSHWPGIAEHASRWIEVTAVVDPVAGARRPPRRCDAKTFQSLKL